MENLVHSIVEMQAELSQRHAELTERQVKQQILIEQDRTAIRDLITISRSLIEASEGFAGNRTRTRGQDRSAN